MTFDLSELNAQQQDALLDSLNPHDKTVVLAGAGSGKTRVVTKRIAYLMNNIKINSNNIMCVTFTNKAANEMKERIESHNINANGMWIGTFHSVCVRILRMFGSHLGINNFSIMDSKDKYKLVSQIIKDSGMPIDSSVIRLYNSKISSCKNALINPAEARQRASNQSDIAFSLIYEEYQNRTWKYKIFDFDDLIVYVYLLLYKVPSVQDWFHKNISHITVDEYQDTNDVQFKLISLLTGNNNLFCVGDDWQSIYGFRNAKPYYIIKFNKFFPDAKIKRFELNYRSTNTIVSVSNSIIKQNANRTDKTMYTMNNDGVPVVIYKAYNGPDESEYISNYITLLHEQGIDYKDIGILYRSNAQSRLVEQYLSKYKIPYQIIGSLSFFDRLEIKDTLCYLKLWAHPNDNISFKRIMKLFKGVGEKSTKALIDYANKEKLNYIEAIPAYKTKNKAVQNALLVLDSIFKHYKTKNVNPVEAIDIALDFTGYIENLQKEDTEESRSRIDNVNELRATAQAYIDKQDTKSIIDFIDTLALATTVDNKEECNDSVKMMTIHSSKGLEFNSVFCIGWEEGLLPHQNALSSLDQIEEECRLAYVGASRAKDRLIISYATRRYNGKCEKFNKPSRFISPIPKSLISKSEYGKVNE